MSEPRIFSTEALGAVRFRGEAVYAQELEKVPGVLELAAEVPRDPAKIRRLLMARSLLLSEGMAPGPYEAARTCAGLFGITEPVEIYQTAGAENAAMHLVSSPVLLEVQGRLLSLLDRDTLRAVVGHELGHYLAHGEANPHRAAALAKSALLGASSAPGDLVGVAQRMSMAMELTADRFGLLACGDLDVALRAEMVAVTGLSAEALTWDTSAYLAQCRELMEETLAQGETALGTSHPEHSLRAYALWLFSESDAYRQLTGTGPGTRTLAEVDELLLRILGRPEVELGQAQVLEEPAPELHECALAACVLVAAADGELHDAELASIERVFAPLVSGWRDYLEPAAALERFQERAPLVTAAGPKTQRALFSLLVHVLAVDGECHPEEIAVVLGIGEALGCRKLYRSLLPPVLAHFGLELAEQEARAIPMPARTGEAQEALRVTFESTARRGGGQVSLRRLLRLMGQHRPSEEATRAIAEAARRSGLTVDPPFGEELDAVHRLVLVDGARSSLPATEPPPPGTGRGDDRLRRGLSRLRDKLVSGDGRSPSVRLHACRAGRSVDLHDLEDVSTGLAERALALLRAGREARVVDGAETGTHDGARRLEAALVALAREHRARKEETGADDLYLGYPFLTGLAGGYLVRAPLLLYPVTIQRDVRSQARIVLTPPRGSAPVANQSALRLLFHKKGLRYPDEVAEHLDELAQEGPEAVVAELAQLGLALVPGPGELRSFAERRDELAGWKDDRLELEECAVLGLFPQSNSDLLQDYDELLTALEGGAVAGEMLGCAAELLPADLRPPGESAAPRAEADPTPPLAPVLYADPVQRDVLARARLTRALVVDGPPGTGKSQVIVNLVADALARGEKVAVVCEKRAALDVVAQRLEGVGLRHLLAVVHDVHEDRRGLYAQVAARLEDEAQRETADGALGRVAEESAACVEELLRRGKMLAAAQGDLSLGELHTFSAALEALPASASAVLADLPVGVMEGLALGVKGLHPYVDLARPGSPWMPPTGAKPRADLAAYAPAEIEALSAALRGCFEKARRHEEACSAAGVAPDEARLEEIKEAAVALSVAVESRSSRQSSSEQEAFVRLLTLALDEPKRLAACLEALGQWQEARDVCLRLGEPVSFRASAEFGAAVEDAGRLHRSFFKLLNPAWWRAGKTLRATLASEWPDKAGAQIDGALLASIEERRRAATGWDTVRSAAREASLPEEFGSAQEAEAWVHRMNAVWRAAKPVAELRGRLVTVGAWPETLAPAALPAWDRRLDALQTVLSAHGALGEALRPVQVVLPWLRSFASACDLAALTEAWARDAERLVASDRRRAEARAVHPSSDILFAQFAASPLAEAPAETWADAVRKLWSGHGIGAIEGREPSIRVLDQADDGKEARLRQAIDEHAQLSVRHVLARQDANPLLSTAPAAKGARRTEHQATREAMLKEAKKQRNTLPLRGFVRRFWDRGLFDVLPVWLLSPETMATLFPRAAVFDQVVLDEASQCTAENGLPALMRARRAVIAGDERQMPPTSFFKTSAEEEDGEAQDGAREMFDAESLLVLARNRVEHLGLGWHYRCLHEELIAFSNHAIYGGSLKTIPSVASRLAPAAVHWVEVPDAQYEDGVNRAEAARVVELIDELLRRADPPTLGVVTFNLTQRRAILDEIDRRRAEDPEFAAVFDAAMARDRIDERPFVKNLETVQGDERDVIVFSLGHAPVERKRKDGRTETYVPARFGPLGQRGGERRLNVAVSRAKKEIYVVASFEPQALSVAKAKHEGPRLFKGFLEFAHHLAHGRRNQSDRVLSLMREGGSQTAMALSSRLPPTYVPLKAQLALELEKQGLRCELDVGTSEFRVPLAVLDQEDPTRYRLGVLCDEGQVVPDPLEAHVHTPRVLDTRGWKLMRVTGREWDRDKERVVREVMAQIGV